MHLVNLRKCHLSYSLFLHNHWTSFLPTCKPLMGCYLFTYQTGHSIFSILSHISLHKNCLYFQKKVKMLWQEIKRVWVIMASFSFLPFCFPYLVVYTGLAWSGGWQGMTFGTSYACHDSLSEDLLIYHLSKCAYGSQLPNGWSRMLLVDNLYPSNRQHWNYLQFFFFLGGGC